MQSQKKGVTLLLAVLFLSAALSIALGIFYIVYVQLQINRSARESHLALFSADAGKECALYYFQNYEQENPDSDSTLGGFWNPENPCLGRRCEIKCAGLTVDVTPERPEEFNDKKSRFTFSLDNPSRGICVRRVTVDTEAKVDDQGTLEYDDDINYVYFRLLSEGQNLCGAGSGIVNRSIEFCSSLDEGDCQ